MTLKIVTDFKNAQIQLTLPQREAVLPFLDPAREQGFLLLQLMDKATKPFMPHEIVVLCEDGFRFSFQARPVQFFEKSSDQGDILWETAFQLDPWTPTHDQELQAALSSTEPANIDSHEQGMDEEAEVLEKTGEGELRGSSPMFRIKAMNPNEKARLAMSANRAERLLLRREKTPQVLMNLLANPRAEAEDVLAVVKSPYTNSGLLDRVAKDRRWNQNAEIRTAIAKNAKTPSPTVIRLLDSLRTEDLRQMSRVGALRENVRREAMKVYMRRSGQKV